MHAYVARGKNQEYGKPKRMEKMICAGVDWPLLSLPLPSEIWGGQRNECHAPSLLIRIDFELKQLPEF